MTDTPKRRGGPRPGAGRPALPADEKRAMREIYLRPATWAAIDSYREERAMSASAAIDHLLTPTDRYARVHDAIADDADLRLLLDETIAMFLEYRDRHGHDEERARAAAVAEIIEGIRATPNLREQGYITN